MSELSFNNVNISYEHFRLMMFLAISDIVFLGCSLPFMVQEYLLSHLTVGVLWCKLSRYFIYTSTFVAIYTIVLMSLDRYCAIVFPLKSFRYRTNKNVAIGLTIISVCSFVASIPALLIFTPYDDNLSSDQTIGRCAVKLASSGADQAEIITGQVFFLLFTTLGYLIPVLAIGGMHLGIYIKLLRTGTLRLSNPRSHAAIHARAAKTVIVLFLMFFICWTPMQVLYNLFYFADLQKYVSFYQLHIAVDTSNGLATLNGCLNPFIYVLSSSEYRAKLKTLIKR